MSWITAAIGATILFSVCVIFDKFFGSKKIKSVYSFAVLLNIIYLPFVIITVFILRDTFAWNRSVFYSFLAGSFWFIMWIFYWKALQIGEASRVAAVFFTAPIYAAFIGLFFLGEQLSLLKWVGIFVIVMGAIMSSLGGEIHKKEVKIAYLFAVLAAVCAAIGNAISKYAMAELPPLMVNSLAYISTIPFYLILLRDRAVRQEVFTTLLNVRRVVQFGIRGLIGYAAIMMNMTAMGLGVISLVTAIGGSQPILILLLSLILSVLFPHVIHEELGRKTIPFKLLSLSLTVLGVIFVSI